MTLEDLNNAEWERDEYDYLVLRHGDVWIWIGLRQEYCDRGHWYANVGGGIPEIDFADSFPRFYMDLETAKKEMRAWLIWRLYKVSDTAHQIFEWKNKEKMGA